MKCAIIIGIATVAILLASCGKNNGSSASSTAPPTVQTDATFSSFPVLQPALTAYLQGDKSTAVSNFLVVDWSILPLFVAGSPLSQSDDQMQTLRDNSEADYRAKSKDLITQLAHLKLVASAVEEAGLDATKKGDVAQAQKCFTSLKQLGTALDSTNYVLIVQLVGRGYEKMSDAGLATTRK